MEYLNKNELLCDIIENSNMSIMEKTIAKEYIYRNEKLKDNGNSNLELNLKNIKYLIKKFMDNKHIWEQIYYTIECELEELDIYEEEKIINENRDKFINELVEKYGDYKSSVLVELILNIFDYANTFIEEEKNEILQTLLPIIHQTTINKEILNNDNKDDDIKK